MCAAENNADAVMPDDNRSEGWAFPGLARKAHYFRDSTSLCGRWLLPRREYDAPLDAAPSPDDCVACRRRVDAELTREGGEN